VISGWRRFGSRSLSLASLLVGLLGSSGTAEGQVGLRSDLAQVGLVARSVPRGTMQELALTAQMTTDGSGEGSVIVRLSTNSSYKLVVRGSGLPAGSRVWVRSADGIFQEVTPGMPVTVARYAAGEGERDHGVLYRVESSTPLAPGRPPIRCELHIAPTI
jgi:hypothetical protein